MARSRGRSAPADDGGADAEHAAEDDPGLDAADMLGTLLRLDLEAAHAYGVAAEVAGPLAPQLRRFERDHLRHVEDLERLLLSMDGGEALVAAERARREDPRALLLASLARLAAPLGERAVVLGLLQAEGLTQAAWDDALSYAWDDGEAERLLARIRGDEERHLAWLLERSDALEGESAGADDAADG